MKKKAIKKMAIKKMAIKFTFLLLDLAKIQILIPKKSFFECFPNVF